MKVIPRLICIEIEIYMKTLGSFTQSYEVNRAGIKPSVTSRNYTPWAPYSPTRTGCCGRLFPCTFITATATRVLVIQDPVTTTQLRHVIDFAGEISQLRMAFLEHLTKWQFNFLSFPDALYMITCSVHSWKVINSSLQLSKEGRRWYNSINT